MKLLCMLIFGVWNYETTGDMFFVVDLGVLERNWYIKYFRSINF